MGKNKTKKYNTITLLIALFKRTSKKRKLQILILFILILLSSFAEMFSLTLIIPFLTVISYPSKLLEYSLIENIYKSLNFETPDKLIFPITFIFCLAIILAASLRLFTVWINGKLAATIGSDFGSEAYSKSLNQSYEDYISTSSSEIISALSIHIDNIISFIDFVLSILSSFFILIGLIITLFVINTKVALSIGLFMGIFYCLIGSSTEKRLVKNSRMISKRYNENTKIIQEGYGSFRDIILDKSQSFYLNLFNSSYYQYRNLRAENVLLGVFPKFIIEAFAICLISLVSISLISTNEGINDALPILGAFALGAQRILPAIQTIYSSLSGIRGGKSSVEIIVSLLDEETSKKEKKISKKHFEFSKNITFENISYKYSDKSNLILKDINFEIKKGERVGIIGKTGSGKSTTIDLLMGLLSPTSGKILVDDKELNFKKDRSFVSEWQSQIGHVPQSIYLTDRSIAENIAFNLPKEKINFKRLKLAAERAQINQFIESIPNKYLSSVGERGIQLSGGQQQRIGIARALYKGASILIFDEATSALDDITENKLMDTIDNLSNYITIIMIAHRLTTIKNCDKLIKLENGKVSAVGTPKEVFKLN